MFVLFLIAQVNVENINFIFRLLYIKILCINHALTVLIVVILIWIIVFFLDLLFFDNWRLLLFSFWLL